MTLANEGSPAVKQKTDRLQTGPTTFATIVYPNYLDPRTRQMTEHLVHWISNDMARAAWTQAWQVTVLILVVVVVTRLSARNRPHLAYVLWLVVLIKCVTPPFWSSPSGLFCWFQPQRFDSAVGAGPREVSVDGRVANAQVADHWRSEVVVAVQSTRESATSAPAITPDASAAGKLSPKTW